MKEYDLGDLLARSREGVHCLVEIHYFMYTVALVLLYHLY